MEYMDGMLDQETTVRLMQACGRTCHIHASGVAGTKKPSREELEGCFQQLEQSGYRLTRESGTVSFTFNWGRDHQNPWGLTMRDGYGMCPLAESFKTGAADCVLRGAVLGVFVDRTRQDAEDRWGMRGWMRICYALPVPGGAGRERGSADGHPRCLV